MNANLEEFSLPSNEKLARELATNPTMRSDLLADFSRRVGSPDRAEAASRILEAVASEPDRLSAEGLAMILYFAGWFRTANKYGIVLPSYSIADSFDDNVVEPWISPASQVRRADGRKWSLMGREIGFPVGIPASPLTSNAAWVGFFARAGYNVLTYKTVRTRKTAPFHRPNWIYLDSRTDALPLGPAGDIVMQGDAGTWIAPGEPKVTSANSFGVPSRKVKQWQKDVSLAHEQLRPEQMLIVSVMGADYENTGRESVLIRDYVDVALAAQKAEAEFIELNLSCPNTLDQSTGKNLRPICDSPALTEKIVRAVREALDSDVKLVAKLAYSNLNKLDGLVGPIGQMVDAYAGINTLQRRIEDRNGQTPFPGRELAGVSGFAIRNHSLDFVKSLALLRVRHQLRFDIIGMGGVTDPQSFLAMFSAGANVVQTSTGAFSNWRLAIDCVEQLGSDLDNVASILDSRTSDALRQMIKSYIESHRRTDKYMVAANMPVPAKQTFEALEGLVRDREIDPRVLHR